MKCVNIHALDLDEKEFGENFNPSRLDFVNDKKSDTTNGVLHVLRKVMQISNINIVKNADGLLNKKPTDSDVEWIGKTKKILPENRLAIS